MATSPRCTIAKMSSRRAPPPSIIGLRCAAALRRCARASATVRATLSVGATRSSSPASGTSSRPSTSTGTDGPASVTCCAVLVEHRADAAPGRPGDDRVADAQRAFLDERGDDRAAALVEVRLEHVRPWPASSGWRRGPRRSRRRRRAAARRAARRRPDPVGAATSSDDRVAAPLLGHELLLGELLAHAGRVGVLAVDLRDRDDDRHLGRACVADRLDRLRHHAVVGGDHEDRDVGDLRAARPHGGERLVARRVDERDAPAVAVDLVRADVLRDATGLAGDDVRVADACRAAWSCRGRRDP